MILREVTRSCASDGHPELHLSFKLSGVSEIEMNMTHWSESTEYEVLSDVLGHGFLFHISVCVEAEC